jgi:hypothetical protein
MQASYLRRRFLEATAGGEALDADFAAGNDVLLGDLADEELHALVELSDAFQGLRLLDVSVDSFVDKKALEGIPMRLPFEFTGLDLNLAISMTSQHSFTSRAGKARPYSASPSPRPAIRPRYSFPCDLEFH